MFYALLVASLYTYVVVVRAILGLPSDFNEHAQVADSLLNGAKAPPHFLYHIVLILIHKITGLSFINAGFVFVFFIVLATYMVAHKGIISAGALNKYLPGPAIIFLLLSHPIAILAPLDKHLYFGYIASNVYHNPTILLLKPIALLHFILICELLSDSVPSNQTMKRVIMLAFLTALSIVAKPSYIIVFLPALLAFIMVARFLLNRNISKQGVILVLAIIGPAVLLLTWQYLWFYGGESTSYIGIDFFAVFKQISALWTLVPKLLLSVAFPISVAFLLGCQLVQRTEFLLSFFMFGISLIYSYALVDSVTNQGTYSGNFFWSAQIAHFILLYVCIKNYLMFLFSEKQRKWSVSLIPMGIGACQLIFGLLWYYTNVNPTLWWQW